MELRSAKPISAYSALIGDQNQSFDLRGWEVYDRDHKRMGIISEIYCNRGDLTAKYVEIIPVEKPRFKNLIYPFESVEWNNFGPAFLNSTQQSLQTFEEYDARAFLALERPNIITYDEALDLGLEDYGIEQETDELCA